MGKRGRFKDGIRVRKIRRIKVGGKGGGLRVAKKWRVMDGEKGKG